MVSLSLGGQRLRAAGRYPSRGDGRIAAASRVSGLRRLLLFGTRGNGRYHEHASGATSRW